MRVGICRYLNPKLDEHGTSAQGRFDPFAKPSANDRYLRSPDGWSRRKPDIADRGFGTTQSGGDRTLRGNIRIRPLSAYCVAEFSLGLLDLCTSGHWCDEPRTIFDAAYRRVYRQVIPIPRLVVAFDHGLPSGENESGHFAIPRFDAPPMLLEV
jgi:hypothetical protein